MKEQEIQIQKDFVEFLGIHKYQYNRYEKNVVKSSTGVLYKIAKKLNMNMEDIIAYSEED